jgi:hypothetical protein
MSCAMLAADLIRIEAWVAKTVFNTWAEREG